MTTTIATAGAMAATGLALIAAAPGVGSDQPALERTSAPRGEGYRCPRDDQNGFKARRLIGKKLPQAHRAARRHECSVRVVKRNGEHLVVTADFSPSRINVGVRHLRVTSIQGVY